MAGFLDELKSIYRNRLLRHQNLPFLEGTMAGCALIATIKGEVSLSQRIRVDQVFEALEALQVFDPHEAVNLFNRYSEAVLKNPREGRLAALNMVKRIAAGDREKAELMIRICLAVSEADGAISLAEQIEIVTLCSILKVTPDRCGLYTGNEEESLIAKLQRESELEGTSPPEQTE
jgi:tellurite resistance protein TerB